MPDLAELLPRVSESTVLRLFGLHDVEAFYRYRSDAVLAEYQAWSPMSLQAATDFVTEMSAASQFRRGGWIQLGIADAASEALVGDTGIFVEADESLAEIGVTLSATAQGKGHAVRAMTQLVPLIFGSTSVSCIRAIADSRNLGSIRMLERCGFVKCHAYDTVFKGQACTEYLFIRWRGSDQR